ncbi:hypothetical protein [Mongoliitalea lutea]|jgi:hypothetical protein|uniref:Uncharacterized protein n=1 Tax=Mongoliitalea lutea TaxID=849756 RepID=A0A8J3CYE5_9BACT|nr:hypothetical protein [Mongoliitalea lutea]GHB37498.1 hypothetical protein GCM10008106_18400 [Mongoliitalea lutea]
MDKFKELDYLEKYNLNGGAPMGSDPLANIGYFAHKAWCALKNRISEVNSSYQGGKIYGPTGLRYP